MAEAVTEKFVETPTLAFVRATDGPTCIEALALTVVPSDVVTLMLFDTD